MQTASITVAATPPDIRWQQQFANFCQALDQLVKSFAAAVDDPDLMLQVPLRR